ncbi:MAG: TonB-dependent receptor [Candidatus Omnitrophica bacterium]|nr:TonB-dependent receptor [Candidatus Omnitrophota bacterium]
MKRPLGGVSVLTLLFCCSTVFAQEIELEKIVITPHRFEEFLRAAGGSVTVITSEEAKEKGLNTVKDVLKNVLGLDVVKTGEYGGQTSVFLRGANSGQTRVMIDGVRVYDPISVNAAFDFAHLTMDNVERIEIVRGPQSALYGSDAMGGVINIITKKGRGKLRYSLLYEGGAHNTFRQAVDLQGQVKKLSYSMSASRLDSDGISQLRNTSEEDSYGRVAVSLRLDYDITDELAIGLIGRHTESRFHYDDDFANKDDADLLNKSRQTIFSSYFNLTLFDFWKQKLQLSQTSNFRRDTNDRDPQFPSDYLRDWYYGKTEQIDWQHIFEIRDFYKIITGFTWQKEVGDYYYFSDSIFGPWETDFPKSSTWNRGWYIENRFEGGDFHGSFSYRRDEHSLFEYHDTYKVDASYRFKTNTKIKGGWGTAYKAPTLYQLYALPIPFFFGGGNINLQPEESESYEAGFEQLLFDEKLIFGATYFHTNFKNLIDAVYNPVTWFTDMYMNVGKARAFGCEAQISYKPFKKLKIVGHYTWMETKDKDTGNELLRRPKNKFTLNINYAPYEKININFNVIYVGHRIDSGNQLLKSYPKADLAINYHINEYFQIFGRLDNLFNEKYEEVKGYATSGFAAYAGIETRF